MFLLGRAVVGVWAVRGVGCVRVLWWRGAGSCLSKRVSGAAQGVLTQRRVRSFVPLELHCSGVGSCHTSQLSTSLHSLSWSSASDPSRVCPYYGLVPSTVYYRIAILRLDAAETSGVNIQLHGSASHILVCFPSCFVGRWPAGPQAHGFTHL